MNKKSTRLRRARRGRAMMKGHGKARLCVHRTSQHMYAQIIDAEGGLTVASASTLEKGLRDTVKNGSNVDAATAVGRLIGERAKAAGVSAVAFDRSGFKYHGRIKAVAEAAREAGMEF